MAELAPSSGVACELKWRFEAWEHRYIDAVTGEEYPHITELLERTGWVDDTWFTEESCERGTQAHRLTADYDLGALDVASCVSAYREYLLSHVAAVALMQPEFLAVLQRHERRAAARHAVQLQRLAVVGRHQIAV